MNTRELMDEALKLAGLEKEPGDTAILVEGEGITKVCMGVDMHTAEILVAKEVGCNCVVGHHPVGGSPVFEFAGVVDSQVERMRHFGVPIVKAQKAVGPLLMKTANAAHSMNYDRNVSAARVLGMPYMNIHQPADLIGEAMVQKHLDEKIKEESTLQDIVDALMEMDEYKNADTKPLIKVGDPKSYAGKVAVTMAGGTDGGPGVHKAYFEAGVGTLVVMHLKDEFAEQATKDMLGNIVVAGHMASDSVGLNAIIKRWNELGVEVVRMSGIIE